jgi:uncharacterized membrane protein
MRKIISIIIFSLTLFLPNSTYAHANSQGDVDLIIQEILTSQSITDRSHIDCSEVTDEEFEILGDAVMRIMHPDESQHDLFDQMMEGEGSSSLQDSHIFMGGQYLGCSDPSDITQVDWDDNWTHGMMDGFPNHMGYFNVGTQWVWFVGILLLLFGLFVGGFIIILLVRKRQGGKKKKDPLNILKERYAKGEINKEEYENMKKL